MTTETSTSKTDIAATTQPGTAKQTHRPVETLRDGALKLAIFRNQSENGTFYSMEPGRIYTDNAGQIKEAKSLSGSEPIRMAKLLDKGYERVLDFKADMKNQHRGPERDR